MNSFWHICEQKTGQEHVDIITFYNEVFVPSVKPLLVELGHAGVSNSSNKTIEDKISSDSKFILFQNVTLCCMSYGPLLRTSKTGQIPGSPRISSFPHLPDMSPKKVSAGHNVYVSPLRSSKVCSFLQFSCQLHHFKPSISCLSM